MLEVLSNLLSAFGLSASAGLNAYLPLLVVALAARFTDLLELRQPYDLLTSGWVITALAILLIIETLADKVPAIDTANDILQTAVRPTAGAILFAAQSNAIGDIHPMLALILGLIVAGGVHLGKASFRPAVTAVTGGTLNPVVSFAEDILALIVTLLSVTIPLMLLIVALLLTIALISMTRPRESVPRL